VFVFGNLVSVGDDDLVNVTGLEFGAAVLSQ